MHEGANINKSLLALTTCIDVLSAPGSLSRHIPYRDSKLTRILQSSLGGTIPCLMIVCLSTNKRYLEDTIYTIRYALKATGIKKRVQENRSSYMTTGGDDTQSERIKDLELEVKILKKKLASGRSWRMNGDHQVLTDHEKENNIEFDNLIQKIVQVAEERGAIKAGIKEVDEEIEEQEKVLCELKEMIRFDRDINEQDEIVAQIQEAADDIEGHLDAKESALNQLSELTSLINKYTEEIKAILSKLIIKQKPTIPSPKLCTLMKENLVLRRDITVLAIKLKEATLAKSPTCESPRKQGSLPHPTDSPIVAIPRIRGIYGASSRILEKENYSSPFRARESSKPQISPSPLRQDSQCINPMSMCLTNRTYDDSFCSDEGKRSKYIIEDNC